MAVSEEVVTGVVTEDHLVLDLHIDQVFDQLHPVTRLVTGIDQLTGSLITQQLDSIDMVRTAGIASEVQLEVKFFMEFVLSLK